jgi:uncharacterized protein YdhG (YjbR/CyaY superfamily)
MLIVHPVMYPRNKEVMVVQVLEKKSLQLYPYLAAEIPAFDRTLAEKFLLEEKLRTEFTPIRTTTADGISVGEELHIS